MRTPEFSARKRCAGKKASALLLVGAFLAVGNAVAQVDVVNPFDTTVQGKVCVGQDCSSSSTFPEIFSTATQLKLKENNLRIRFINSTSTGLGASWVLEANDSSNGGPSAFSIFARSFEQRSSTISVPSPAPLPDVKRSYGLGRAYDCGPGESGDGSAGQPYPSLLPDFAPLGETLVTIEGDPTVGPWICNTIPWWTEALLFRAGTAGDDFVTLGEASQPLPGETPAVVSVGATGTERVIKHVAPPTSSSDALTMASLTFFPDEVAELNTLSAAIESVKARLAALEAADADDDTVPNGTDVFPLDPDESADSDGDGIGDNADSFPLATTTGTDQGATLSMLPGSDASTCSVDSSVAAVDATGAPGPAVSRQASFSFSGCGEGESVTVTIDFGEAFPPRGTAFKIDGGEWQRIPGAIPSGTTVTYTITDNGPLDLNPAAGVIEDPVGVASPPPVPVPLPLWLAVLAALGVIGTGIRLRRD